MTQRRKLGNSGLEISPLAFGGNIFGWTVDQAQAFKLLDAFVDAGFNLIDTADIYSTWVPGNSGGESETVIGQWLKQSGKRDKVLIATKVGMEMARDKRGLSGPYIHRAAEESLRRLQMDHIDLYQAHVDDPNTPLEETLTAFGQLMRQGKVRAIGASNYDANRLSHALAVSAQGGYPRYECLQPLYNLYERAPYEAELEAVCTRNGLGVISYFSLASGFLSGKYRSEKDLVGSARAGRVKKYLDDRGRRILAALDEVSKSLDATPAQISLAWLMARPSVTAPIASATSLKQFEDLVAAAHLELDHGSIEKLNQASAY